MSFSSTILVLTPLRQLLLASTKASLHGCGPLSRAAVPLDQHLTYMCRVTVAAGIIADHPAGQQYIWIGI